MRIVEVSATAGTTFNHPHEKFRNFKPSITLHAELDEGDDAFHAIFDLQEIAEAHVARHRERILTKLEMEFQESLPPALPGRDEINVLLGRAA